MNSPAMVWRGSSVFNRARKINLAASEKVRIFASDFNSEINEALYLRLVFRKREKLPIMMQGSIMARAYSVDCLPHLIIRVILTTSEIKKWYTVPRFM